MSAYLNGLKNWRDFKGRTRRSEFWVFCLIHTLVFLAALIAILGYVYVEYGSFLSSQFEYFNDPVIIAIMGGVVIYSVATALPLLALMVRRLHDAGFTGWFYCVRFIPLICLIINQAASIQGFDKSILPYYLSIFVGDLLLMYFWVKDSQPGHNYWGENPKGVESDEIAMIGFGFD